MKSDTKQFLKILLIFNLTISTVFAFILFQNDVVAYSSDFVKKPDDVCTSGSSVYLYWEFTETRTYYISVEDEDEGSHDVMYPRSGKTASYNMKRDEWGYGVFTVHLGFSGEINSDTVCVQFLNQSEDYDECECDTGEDNPNLTVPIPGFDLFALLSVFLIFSIVIVISYHLKFKKKGV